jgi:hypothetical protein
MGLPLVWPGRHRFDLSAPQTTEVAQDLIVFWIGRRISQSAMADLATRPFGKIEHDGAVSNISAVPMASAAASISANRNATNLATAASGGTRAGSPTVWPSPCLGAAPF